MAVKTRNLKITGSFNFTLSKLMAIIILADGSLFSYLNPTQNVMETTIMITGAMLVGKTGFTYLSNKLGINNQNTSVSNTVEVEDPPPPVPESK